MVPYQVPRKCAGRRFPRAPPPFMWIISASNHQIAPDRLHDESFGGKLGNINAQSTNVVAITDEDFRGKTSGKVRVRRRINKFAFRNNRQASASCLFDGPREFLCRLIGHRAGVVANKYHGQRTTVSDDREFRKYGLGRQDQLRPFREWGRLRRFRNCGRLGNNIAFYYEDVIQIHSEG